MSARQGTRPIGPTRVAQDSLRRGAHAEVPYSETPSVHNFYQMGPSDEHKAINWAAQEKTLPYLPVLTPWPAGVIGLDHISRKRQHDTYIRVYGRFNLMVGRCHRARMRIHPQSSEQPARQKTNKQARGPMSGAI